MCTQINIITYIYHTTERKREREGSEHSKHQFYIRTLNLKYGGCSGMNGSDNMSFGVLQPKGTSPGCSSCTSCYVTDLRQVDNLSVPQQSYLHTAAATTLITQHYYKNRLKERMSAQGLEYTETSVNIVNCPHTHTYSVVLFCVCTAWN